MTLSQSFSFLFTSKDTSSNPLNHLYPLIYLNLSFFDIVSFLLQIPLNLHSKLCNIFDQNKSSLYILQSVCSKIE